MIKGLDGLRAIAVLLVILQHYWPSSVQSTRIHFGTIGVLIFFTLSGFLITRILLKSRGLNTSSTLTGFFMRRFLRIFPIYYATVLITPILGYKMMGDMLWWNVTYTSNIYIFLSGKWPNEASHLWSLALEEQFYIIWPFVILMLPRNYLAPALALICISSPLSMVILHDMGATSASLKSFPLSTIEYLIAGSAIAYIEHYGSIKKHIPILAATAIASCSLLISYHIYSTPIPEYMLMTIGLPIAVFVVSFIHCNQSSILVKFLSYSPIAGIGKISYGIYLYHNFMPRQAHHLSEALNLGLSSNEKYIAAVFLTIGLSWLSYNLVEKQILKLKRFFPYSKSTSQQQAYISAS